MTYRRIIPGVLLLAGCGITNRDLREAPTDWSTLDGRTVTVRGTAGNSPQGPIVRMDNGYIPLKTRERWGIDAVARPIVVTGRVVSGQGFRTEKYVLEVEKIEVPPPEQTAGPSDDAGKP